MKTITVVVVLFHIESSLGTKCEGIPTLNRGEAINCSRHCLDWSELQLTALTSLSLKNCGISRIINITANTELRKLNLMNNKLQDLPQNFLKSFSKLTELNLVGNPLKSIPLSLIKEINVNFSCSCHVLEGIFHSCGESLNCTQSSLNNVSCIGRNGIEPLTLDNFYKAECTGLMLVYILVPILIIVVIAIVVLVLVKYRSKITTHFSPPPSKRQSVCSTDRGQERYASAANWKDAAAGSHGAARETPHRDYENVFMEDSDKARKQQTPDDTYYLESDAACEIYQNEQPVYCNYTGPAAKAEDDIYIVPDH
ncbi:uncharacterized protein LOC127582682 isoform X2 [Pristis pectinata]|nr:uncharacterized protein LOC127582682 isoform X2 [Pristis pectinata]XP_051894188.1 uncharacterized protein LOC127582682 isoform X2 [Pristis pectinata]